MRSLSRISVFFLTLFFGSGLAAAASWSGTIVPIPTVGVAGDIAKNRTERTVYPDGVQLIYAGVAITDDGESTYLKFIVFNGTSGKLEYFGSKEGPGSKVRVNGRILLRNGITCDFGSKVYTIGSGESAEFAVGPHEFGATPKSDDKITIGFHLKDENSEKADELISEPFLLPDEFLRAVKKRELTLPFANVN